MQVYRYLQKQYVERFFDVGELQLSSFIRCRNHEDSRADSREGKSNFLIQTQTNTIAGLFNVGAHTNLLCTSRVFAGHLMRKFNVDDYFVIRRPLHFANAITECLKDVTHSCLGDCAYSDTGPETSSEASFMELPDFGNMNQEKAELWFERQQQKMLAAMRSTLGDKGFFSKRIVYSDEKEFRFVWTLSRPPADNLLIKCKDAVRFCRSR